MKNPGASARKLVRRCEVKRQERPEDHRDRRVVHHRDEPRPRLEQQVRVPPDERANAPQRRRHAAMRIDRCGDDRVHDTISSASTGSGSSMPARDVEKHFFHRVAAVALDQLRGRSLVHDVARAQHDHVGAHPLDLAHVVRREQHRAAARSLVVLEVGAHSVADVRIERGRWLVEQQHVGPVEQRLGKRDARALAGRQLPVGTLQQIDQVELG